MSDQPSNLQEICREPFEKLVDIRKNLGLGILKCRIREADPTSNQFFILPEVNDETIRIYYGIKQFGLIKFLGYELSKGNAESVNLLLSDNPGLLKASDREGNRPLFYAVLNPKMLELLLDIHDVPADQPNFKNQSTALMYAAELGSGPELLKSINLLLDRGAKINAIDDNGETALIKAVSRINYDTAKLLLEKGADPNIQDFTDRTALQYARQNPEFVALLKGHGAQ